MKLLGLPGRKSSTLEPAMALEIPGDHHLYENLDTITPLIEAWWANRSPRGG